jgi:hypothetical protein
MSLPGFEDGRHPVGEASYFVSQGGSGPAVLLLHGFPETHAPAGIESLLAWPRLIASLPRTCVGTGFRGPTRRSPG